MSKYRKLRKVFEELVMRQRLDYPQSERQLIQFEEGMIGQYGFLELLSETFGDKTWNYPVEFSDRMDEVIFLQDKDPMYGSVPSIGLVEATPTEKKKEVLSEIMELIEKADVVFENRDIPIYLKLCKNMIQQEIKRSNK